MKKALCETCTKNSCYFPVRPRYLKKHTSVMNDKEIPFEAWQLIQSRDVLKWVRTTGNFSINSINEISCIEDRLFKIAYDKMGLKPISKCSIQELEVELRRRLGNENF